MSAQLLVSVRSAAEARLALMHGAALIDIKEPDRGSLGRADDAVIAAVVDEVEGKCPVSAALGELREFQELPGRWEALSFVKWGLSGCAGTTWPGVLFHHAARLGSRVVAVAYADAEKAQAPSVEEVVAFICGQPWPDPVLLIDTFDKSSTTTGRVTLLDSLPLEVIAEVSARCRANHVRIALAGSLHMEEIHKLWPLRPDWFAVRSAVCEQDRKQELQAGRVQLLVDLLRELGSEVDDSHSETRTLHQTGKERIH
jgi:uncharacterized protein (UPF0264 family)